MTEYSKVIQFGEARLRLRGRRGWKDERCKHLSLTYDDNGEIVTCDDCNAQVTAFWAMKMLAEHYDKAMQAVEARSQHVAEQTSRNLHLMAARKVEKAWRSRSMVPCCPHCDAGIFPEDGLGGTQINRQIEMARRIAKTRATPPTQQPTQGAEP